MRRRTNPGADGVKRWSHEAVGKIIATYCDSCGKRGSASPDNATAARRKNQEHGWYNKGGTDLCSACYGEIGRHVPDASVERTRGQWSTWMQAPG